MSSYLINNHPSRNKYEEYACSRHVTNTIMYTIAYLTSRCNIFVWRRNEKKNAQTKSIRRNAYTHLRVHKQPTPRSTNQPPFTRREIRDVKIKTTLLLNRSKEGVSTHPQHREVSYNTARPNNNTVTVSSVCTSTVYVYAAQK